MRREVVARHELTSNGARGKPYHFCCAPQVTRAGRGGAAVEAAFDRDDLRARRVILNASFSAFSFASAPLLTKNTLSKASPQKSHEPRRRAPAHVACGTALLWKLQRARLLGQRLGPARVAVAERGDGVAAVEIEHRARRGVAATRLRRTHFDRILRKHRREVIRAAAVA